METLSPPWRRCTSCKLGRIVLFTSVVRCAECIGTGIDLSDERLQVVIATQQVMVRTHKLLHKHGIDTLGQLLCLAMQGGLTEDGPFQGTTFGDAGELLRRWGLPSEPARDTPTQ